MRVVLREHGYRPERESGVESRLAVSNGFLGVRAARAISRGHVGILVAHIELGLVAAHVCSRPVRYAKYPTAGAGARARTRLAENSPAAGRETTAAAIRRIARASPYAGYAAWALLIEWRHRDAGRVAHVRSIRFVSLADRAIGVQLLELSVDKPAEITSKH